MSDNNEYLPKLNHALRARAEWLEKADIPKLKEGLQAYRVGFAFLYNLYLKNGLIKEDPYKNETQVQEVVVPNAADFKDEEKLDQLTQRLANYDNQLDYIANSCQLTPDNLTIDLIKKITGVIRYIDWVHLTTETGTPVTKAVAKMTGDIMSGNDAMTLKIANESVTNLNKFFTQIMNCLKAINDYQRETFKLDLRDITDQIPANEINVDLIKKKFTQMKQGVPFYPDLAEEVIREDYSKDGPNLKAALLKKLQIPGVKPPAAKPSIKTNLIEGIQILANMTGTLEHIAETMDSNRDVLDSKKKSFIQKLKELFSKDAGSVIYEVKYMDHTRGVPVYEKVITLPSAPIWTKKYTHCLR